MKSSLRQALSAVLSQEARRYSSSLVSIQSRPSPLCNTSSSLKRAHLESTSSKLLNQQRTPSHVPPCFDCRRYFSIQPQLTQSNKFNVKSTELSVPVPWGVMSGQTFGDPVDKATNKPNKPIVALHGYLDNSNSFKPLASILCNHGYYVVALDFPGHGFSSHVSKGMFYSPKVFLTSVRRVLKHLNLNKFMMITHSFGSNIALLYDTVFPNEMLGLFMIDYVINLQRRKQEDLHTYWQKSIDGHIEIEQKQLAKKKEAAPRAPLTHEFALNRLMEANKHLDVDSAKLLLERGLVVNPKSELNFSRDIKVKLDFSFPDLFLEVLQLFPNIKTNFSAPTQLAYAWPPSYGEESFASTKWLIDRINAENKKTQIECVQYEGSHHLHMINPQLFADLIQKFIKEKNIKFD